MRLEERREKEKGARGAKERKMEGEREKEKKEKNPDYILTTFNEVSYEYYYKHLPGEK